ncbi:unnamed protein product, partial [Thelazia callipaeda]|uniref:WD_REPEATS_REGION domain-containing protein n=1 Tax=Thelazia callipaeda TaxID=103827 RepID=A0A0N5CW36_THECL
HFRVIGQSFPYNSWATGTSEVSSGSGLIVRTHILNGHKRTVLSVDTTGTTVISGSKDRTAKVWDLEKGVEKCSFHHHPNSVSCVRFIPNSHMALTVSLSFIRIWDLRSEQCVRTLHSSGLADSHSIFRKQKCFVCKYMQSLNALILIGFYRLMFTTFNNDVRIWNLEKFATFGRLSGATQSSKSEISCLGFLDGVRPRIFTGSRDHRLKMYEINIDGLGLFEAAHEFSSAHHECITSLLPYGDVLFSASKNLIMRFSLQDMKRDHIELQAHNKWIQSMRILEADKPLLVTACKEARIKLWDITSTRKLRLLYEIDHAHDGAINEIATYSSMLFTVFNYFYDSELFRSIEKQKFRCFYVAAFHKFSFEFANFFYKLASE